MGDPTIWFDEWEETAKRPRQPQANHTLSLAPRGRAKTMRNACRNGMAFVKAIEERMGISSHHDQSPAPGHDERSPSKTKKEARPFEKTA